MKALFDQILERLPEHYAKNAELLPELPKVLPQEKLVLVIENLSTTALDLDGEVSLGQYALSLEWLSKILLGTLKNLAEQKA